MKKNELSSEDLHFLKVSSENFKKGQSFKDYKKDIKRWLMICPRSYSSEDADETIEKYKVEISKAHYNKVSVADIACDIGYCCGWIVCFRKNI